MAVVGVLARIDTTARAGILAALALLPGISTFPVGDDLRVGILVERATLDDAHRAVMEELKAVPGLLAAWPVFAHADGEGVGGAELAACSLSGIQSGEKEG